MTQLEKVRQQVTGESGAEIVEWILWVGGIAVLAGSLFALFSGSFTTLATNIMGSVGAVGS
jgi:hypothetical protein